jgi:hypothetical protein
MMRVASSRIKRAAKILRNWADMVIMLILASIALYLVRPATRRKRRREQ